MNQTIIKVLDPQIATNGILSKKTLALKSLPTCTGKAVVKILTSYEGEKPESIIVVI